jgi:C4-dicarboxylate-specific signal transduction histidine kinase
MVVENSRRVWKEEGEEGSRRRRYNGRRRNQKRRRWRRTRIDDVKKNGDEQSRSWHVCVCAIENATSMLWMLQIRRRRTNRERSTTIQR